MSIRCVRPASQTTIVASYGSSHDTPSRSTGQVGPRSTCPSIPEVAPAVAVVVVAVVSVGDDTSSPSWQAASRAIAANATRRVRLLSAPNVKDVFKAETVPTISPFLGLQNE